MPPDTPWKPLGALVSECEDDSQQVLLQTKAGSAHLAWVPAGGLLAVSGTGRKRTE